MKLFSLPDRTRRLVYATALPTGELPTTGTLDKVTLSADPGLSNTPTTASTLEPPVSISSSATADSNSPLLLGGDRRQTHASSAWRHSVEPLRAQRRTPETPSAEQQAYPNLATPAGLRQQYSSFLHRGPHSNGEQMKLLQHNLIYWTGQLAILNTQKWYLLATESSSRIAFRR